jgi:hypothetical protein
MDNKPPIQFALANLGNMSQPYPVLLLKEIRVHIQLNSLIIPILGPSKSRFPASASDKHAAARKVVGLRCASSGGCVPDNRPNNPYSPRNTDIRPLDRKSYDHPAAGIQQWLCPGCFVASVLSPARDPLPMRYMNRRCLVLRDSSAFSADPVFPLTGHRLSLCSRTRRAVRCLRPSSFDPCALGYERLCNGAPHP